MNYPRIDVEVDEQHGPIVRVTTDEGTISAYLAEKVAVVTTDTGQFGKEVSGDWSRFYEALKQLGEHQ